MADVLFSERIKNRMKKWRDELLHDRNCEIQFSESSNDSKQQIQTIFYRARPALALSGFTAHQLRLIQQVIPFSGILFPFSVSGLEIVISLMLYIYIRKREVDLLGY